MVVRLPTILDGKTSVFGDYQVAAYSDKTGMTGQYDTPISRDQMSSYEKWKKSFSPNDPGYDYDYQGAFKAGVKKDARGHLTDKFKKPNHPTFSTQSQYSGKNGNIGGKWQKNSDGSWTFYASETNLKYNDPADLERYFKEREPGNKLVLPGEKK